MNKQKNILNLLLITLPVVTFLIWYFGIAIFDVFSMDDFWHGDHVQKYGFWGAQKWHYNNWEGSYTYTFFAFIPHISTFKHLFNEGTWFYCFVSLLLLILSTSYFLIQFNVILKNLTSILVSSYLISLLYLFSIGGSDILFWTCVNFTQVIGVCFLLIGISFLKQFRNSNLQYLSIAPFILVAGNKLNYCTLLLLTLLILLWKSDFFSCKSFRCLLIVSLVILPVLINISASGNIKRLDYNISNLNSSLSITFLEALYYRIFNVVFPILYRGIIFSIPLCFCIPNNFDTKSFIKILLGILGFQIIIETIIFYNVFKDWGPSRSNILIEYMAIFLSVSIVKYLTVKFQNYYSEYSFSVSIAIITILIYSNFINFHYISVAHQYYIDFNKRIEIVRKCNTNTSTLFISPLPNSGLIHSAYCNNVIWLNNVFTQFYNCNKIIEIK